MRRQLTIINKARRGDHLQRSVNDCSCRTIITAQGDRAHRWKVFTKPLKQTGIGATKSVYRLVRIADHTKIAVRRRQQLDQAILSGIDVLELVHANPAEAGTVIVNKVGIGFQKFDRQDDQVIEIDESVVAEVLLIDVKCLSEFCFGVRVTRRIVPLMPRDLVQELFCLAFRSLGFWKSQGSQHTNLFRLRGNAK